MEGIRGRKRQYQLRRNAAVAWLIAGALALLLLLLIRFWRNPWVTHNLSGEQLTVETLQEIAESTSPYVRVSDLYMQFTGFYEVDKDETVRAYCYSAQVGDEYILVDIPATDGGELVAEGSLGHADIDGDAFAGRVTTENEMLLHLAQSEEMTEEEYAEAYDMSGIEIKSYHNDQEKIRIYQMMLMVPVIGLAAVGFILRSEAASIEEEERQLRAEARRRDK